MQGVNGDADSENRLVGTAGEGECGTNGVRSMETHTSPHVKQLVGVCCMTQRAETWCSVTTEGMGWARRELQEGGDTWTPMADSR